MADNTVLNTGTGGDVIATDDIGGTKHQLVKVEFGAADSATQVSAANPLPVDQPNVTVADGGALPAKGMQVGGTDGSVFQVLSTDNAGRLNANINGTVPVSGTVSLTANSAINNAQVSGTAVSVNSGVKDAGTQRVILASDQTVVPVSDNSGSLTVDAPVGTPAFVTATPSTTGGWSKVKYAAQTTTVQTVKGTAGTFGGYYVFNGSAATAYVQVFDVASATTVTLGTTVPDMIFGIPAGAGANLEVTNGVNMALGIKLACTTTATGLTAPATGLDLTVFYK